MRRYGPVKDAVHLLLCDVKNNISMEERARDIKETQDHTNYTYTT